jgi:hypothetical protein
MKTLKQNYREFLAITAISGTLMLTTVIPSFADDHFHHDDHGYWDGHHQYHHYAYYQNHRGYWDERNGVRIFINL